MADNTTLPNGDQIRDIDNGSGVKTPVSMINFGTVNAEKFATLGQQTSANSIPVVLPSAQASQLAQDASVTTINTNIGAQADASATTDTGTFSLIALIKRMVTKLSSILTAQSDGTQKSILRGGTVGTTAAADASVLSLNANHHPLEVAMVDGSGAQVTSFGGGQQYSNGSTQATPTGTVALGWDGTLVKALPLDGSGFLKVNVAAGGASGGTSSNVGAAVPGTATADGWSDGTNMQIPRVFDADSGAGTQYVPGVNLRLSASGGSVEGGTASNPIRVDPTGTTAQPVKLADTAGAGINSVTDNGLNALAVAVAANVFPLSTVNSTTAQLSAGATFTGAIEAVPNQPSISVDILTDQNGTLVIEQFITNLAASICSSNSYSVTTAGFCRSFPLNGNYVRVKFTNNGGVATTTLNISTAYGSINASTNKLNLPVSLEEIAGTSLTPGQKTMANSIPVVIPSDQSAVPISATSLPLPTGAALDATLTGGTAKIINRGGAKGTTVAADVTSTASGANHQPLDVAIYDAAGNQITSFGGGAQYSEGTTQATPTGTVALGRDGSNVLKSLLLNALQFLRIDLSGINGTVTSVNDGLPDAGTQRVAMAGDLYFTGQAAQTATVNNIIPAIAGAGWTDVSGFQSGSIQVVSTGTGGTFIFECSNDGTNAQIMTVKNMTVTTGAITTAAITASASSLIYEFPIATRYIRLRIATAITGGSIQAFSTFKRSSLTQDVVQVSQNTAGSLNAAVVGSTAHSAASGGNPVRVAGRCITTLDTTLVQGDVSDLAVSSGQQLVTKDFATSENDWQFVGTVTTTTQTAIKAAGAASIRNFVTGITYQNTNATATTLLIQDGSTTILSISCAASMANPVNLVFPTPLRGTAATAINYTAGTTGANVLLNVQGYQSF